MLLKFLRWIGNIGLLLLVTVSIIMVISAFQSKNNPGEIPSVLGYHVLNVLSGSMEPTFSTGDLIIIKNDTSESSEMNDIITYRNNQNTIVTHRIVALVEQQGETLFQTKGDANNIEDRDLVENEQILGTMQFHIPKAGILVDILTSPAGLIILAMIPLLILAVGILTKLFSNNEEKHNKQSTFRKEAK